MTEIELKDLKSKPGDKKVAEPGPLVRLSGTKPLLSLVPRFSGSLPYEDTGTDFLPTIQDVEDDKEKIQLMLEERTDPSLAIIRLVIYGILVLLVFFVIILPIFNGLRGVEITEWADILANIDPYFWSSLGLGLNLSFSIIGASWGILTIAPTLVFASIRTPRVAIKNLISIVFCEAIGMYGLILTIIMTMKYKSLTEPGPADQAIPVEMTWQYVGSGYVYFVIGISVGISNLAAATAIGALGSSCVIADAANPKLFVRVIIVEIFAEAIAVFAMFIGIVLQFKINFESPAFKVHA